LEKREGERGRERERERMMVAKYAAYEMVLPSFSIDKEIARKISALAGISQLFRRDADKIAKS